MVMTKLFEFLYGVEDGVKLFYDYCERQKDTLCDL